VKRHPHSIGIGAGALAAVLISQAAQHHGITVRREPEPEPEPLRPADPPERLPRISAPRPRELSPDDIERLRRARDKRRRKAARQSKGMANQGDAG
jgi:hypothetical protein